MCGVAGFVNLDGRPLVAGVDDRLLDAMGDSVRHRGPDDAAVMLWENVGFVFRRLSIVDLDDGRQPFEAADGRVCAMVNGEIFNHEELRRSLGARAELRSRSDCEVVPWLWLERGHDLFADVDGMYAAVILDRRERRLLLARDRMGVKPLFYCLADGGRTLVFASELKGLFAHPSVPRMFDWRYALRDPHLPDVAGHELQSGFVGVERVPAASIVEIALDGRSHRTHRYWRLPDERPDAGAAPPARYARGYAERLQESVERQLMSDVGFGIFLSGGLDSSVMTALAARRTRDFPTFSVLSRSTIASGDAEAAHRVAQTVGVRNHQVRLDELELPCGPDAWRRILWSCERHAIGAEQLFKFNLHAYARDRYPGLKVMLLGQGSDEFTGGYVEWLIGGTERRRREGRRWTASDLPAMRAALEGVGMRRAVDEMPIASRFRKLFERGTLDAAVAGAWTGRELGADTLDVYMRAFRANLDHHLWHEDRTAAAHGIENRVPFLDHRVIEAIAEIPTAHRGSLLVDKAILREFASQLLPPDLASRPKGYFFYGRGQKNAFALMHAILTRNAGELVEQAVAGSMATGGPLDAEGLRALARASSSSPGVESISTFIDLVNMGVLADLARNTRPNSSGPCEFAAVEINFAKWSQTSRAQEALRRARGLALDDALVPMLGPGYSIVSIDKAIDPDGRLSPGVYVANGHTFMPVSSGAAAKALLLVDGIRSVGAIVREARVNRSLLLRHLAVAIDEGVVVVHDDVPL